MFPQDLQQQSMFFILINYKAIILYNKMKNEFDEATLKTEYEKIQKQNKSSMEIIHQLNQFYKFDQIVLREALKKYEKKETLDNNPNYQQIRDFYIYLYSNADNIEKTYLQWKPEQQNAQEAHYLANKNNISKFLNDERQHFKDAYNSLAEPINEEQRGLRGTSIGQFFQNLFTTKYSCVLYNGNNYFQGESYGQSIREKVKKFYLCSGDKEQATYTAENYWLQFDDITDLLEFWARQYNKENMFVLYARSETYLQRQKQYLIQKGDSQQVQHPASSPIMTKKQNKEEIQEQINPQVPDKSEKNNANLLAFLNKYKSKSNAYDESSLQPLYHIQKKKLTKEEILDHRLIKIFDKICKKRAVLPKGSTFDRIQSQNKNMNMQKFFFFCTQFELNKIFSKEVLTQMFKLHAINLRTLDFERFKQLIHSMIQTDKSIIDKILSYKSINKTSDGKQTQIGSKYKFLLKPVAGKDINAIKQQLSIIKTAKNSRFQERTQNLLKSKIHLQPTSTKNVKNHNSYMSIPNKTNIYDIEDIRDDDFHPQKLFKLDNQQDKLWRIYQSKIWKQDVNDDHFGMGGMDVLDKRIVKGQKVLKKMTQKNIKYY